MKNRAACAKWGVILALCVGALALIAAVMAAFVYLRQQLPRYSAEFTVPMVIVSEPASGTSVPARGNTVVLSTSSGSRPIARVELWLDGALKVTQNSQRPEGYSPFESALPLAIDSGGPHVLFVRAIDTAGLIGQSQPVTLVGGTAPDPNQMTGSALVDPGQTYEDIAKSLGTDTTRLRQLNPGLGVQQPPAGSVIKVPVPRQETGQAASAPPPSAGGTIQLPDKPALKVVQAFPFWANPPLTSTHPAPPDGLQGQVKDCKLELRWNDNSTNEAGYEVWVSGPGLLPWPAAKLQASPSSGPASAQIAVPQSGSLNVWVEALDSAGSQPSNIISASVDPTCLAGKPTELQVEALDMTVPGSAGNTYCYLSVMNAPHLRVPANDGEFIQAAAGKADIAAWAAADHKMVAPIPSDGVLPLSGSCLAWEGSTLVELGSFQASVASALWDGKRHAVYGDSFEIGLAINPLGGTTMTTYGLPLNSTIPAPYDLFEGDPPNNPLFQGNPPARMLHWKWDGDPKTINGFTILFNGKPVASYNYPDMRDVVVRLPGSCGHQVRWEVVAVATVYGHAGPGGGVAMVQSPPSNAVQYFQQKCKSYLVLKFNKLDIRTTDEEGFAGDCPNLEAYYALIGPHQGKKFYYPGGPFTGSSFFTIQCFHSYSFYDMGHQYDKQDPYPDTVVAPIDDQNIHIWWSTMFFDYDQWTGDDWFGDIYSDMYADNPQLLVDLFGCGKTYTDPFYNDTAGGSVTYTISVVPNSCTDVPPYIP
jgi:LysM repeat protein